MRSGLVAVCTVYGLRLVSFKKFHKAFLSGLSGGRDPFLARNSGR